MQKIFLMMLALFLLSATNVHAQVTIGSEFDPHPGAALDIQSIKGLLLPTVAIFDTKQFQLAADSEKDTAVGMLVYNTNENITDGQGAGLYVWDGTKWLFAGLSGPVATPVLMISVSPSGTSIMSGQTQPFSANVIPSNATNSNVSWSVLPGTGSGTITSTGLFTAGTAGTVTVRATATDGNNVYGEQSVTVTPAIVAVTSVSVTSTGGTSLNAGSTLQLTATVSPSNASNKAVTWSIVSGTAATVDQNGIVTGTGNGDVTVRATADADIGIYGEIILSVTQIIGPTIVTGNQDTYNVYCYPNNVGCWMIDNSKEGTYIYTTYPNSGVGERGYYYSWAQAANACPPDYHLPNETEWKNLVSYINPASGTERAPWVSGSALAGYYTTTNNAWIGWNTNGFWWSSGTAHQFFFTDKFGMRGPLAYDDRILGVRCVKSN